MTLRFSKLHIMDTFKRELRAGRELTVIRKWHFDLLGRLEISNVMLGYDENTFLRCILNSGVIRVGTVDRLPSDIMKVGAIIGRPQ